MKILIVDDKKENLFALKTMLERSSYEVLEASNGVEALEKVKSEHPDIIISDILMPKMDGFQLCREVKGDKDLRKIPFIFYTATYIEQKDEEFALSLGAERFIRKPAEQESFLSIIEEVFKNYKEGWLVPREVSSTEEKVYLKTYNERLVKKLEDKMLQQDAANKELTKYKEELEKKVAEQTQELRGAQEKLIENERLAALGKMASSVAHELRNPMGVIRLAVYSLKKKIGSKNPRLIKHLENIDKKITESDQIIHDLLAFSRASELEFKFNHLNESVEKGLEAVEHTAKEQNVKIIKNLDPQMPKIVADFNQLIEIFYNLFLNAIQAMKESPKKELRVNTRHQKEFVEIEIEDTGHGISKENLKKLGEPFFSTKTKGIGLGLYITYEIISRHKGKVEVKSEVGKGTTFTIILPTNLYGENKENNFNR